MSLELNADNFNATSFTQDQKEIQTKNIEENKINQLTEFNNTTNTNQENNSNKNFEQENKEKESKLTCEIKDTYDDNIKITKKDNPQNYYNNYNNQSDYYKQSTGFSKEAHNPNYGNNYSNFSNATPVDLNKINQFTAGYSDSGKYYDQSKTKFSSTDNYQTVTKPNSNSKSNFSNSNNTLNTSNVNNNDNYSNTNAASNYWKMRYSMNPSLFQRIMREDEQLVQEHIHNQKKKETLVVSDYKNIDIDISFNTQKIIERSEFTYFDDILDLDAQLKKNLHLLNFKLMTPIQREVIKFIREGQDVMGCSQTGSGKTIAFLLPIVSRILNEMPLPLNNSPPSPRLLILIPTRELAEQIWTEAKKLVKETGIIVNKIYGGVPHDEQLEKMYSGCDILVATPGRLLDFVKNNNLTLKNVKYLIMDEADRMLDMGFQPQLMKIAFGCDLMHKDLRQNLLFSATFTEEIKNISKNFMRENHYFIQTIFEKNPSKNIKQELYYAAESEKIDKLHGILRGTSGSIIIFVETKFGVDNLYLALKKYGHRVSCIHGDKKQIQRQEAIKRFSLGQISILIATDIASRGLDFPKVTHVINFDLPTNIEDYIHRIGRTGRCGNTGTAISFVNEYNKPIIRNLYYFMKKNHQKMNDWFENLYRNCKDINVNIFDRIPKKPKRSLGAHGANRYQSSSSNFGNSNYPSNANSNFNSMNNYSNANNFNAYNNMMNQDGSVYNNYNNAINGNMINSTNINNNYSASATNSTLNNFVQPASQTSTYDRSNRYEKSEKYDRNDKYEKSDKYDKHDKYDSKRESSSSKYNQTSSSSGIYNAGKFSGSTTYNPSTDSVSKETNYNKSSADYRSSGTSYKNESSSRHSSRATNDHQFLGKKHPYPSSSTSSKDNEESSYQKHRRSRYEGESKSSSRGNDNNDSNYSSSRTDYNRKGKYDDYSKDSRDNKQSGSSGYNNSSSNYRSSDKNAYDKSSNFQASAGKYRNNFSDNPSNNFSSYPSAGNSYSNNLKTENPNMESKGNTSKTDNANMYAQMPGMAMNYMYPGMNYANYYTQSNLNNKTLNTQENLNKDNNNKPNDNSINASNAVVNSNSQNNQANPADGINTDKNSNLNNSNNAYSAYYNYAAAYSAYGYGANYPGYNYNGQVYDAYKYNYNYPGMEANASNNNAASNTSNEKNEGENKN